jgi:hypothetical protein
MQFVSDVGHVNPADDLALPLRLGINVNHE